MDKQETGISVERRDLSSVFKLLLAKRVLWLRLYIIKYVLNAVKCTKLRRRHLCKG